MPARTEIDVLLDVAKAHVQSGNMEAANRVLVRVLTRVRTSLAHPGRVEVNRAIAVQPASRTFLARYLGRAALRRVRAYLPWWMWVAMLVGTGWASASLWG